jgi:2-(1,2-epoxy-1,2-dihydrophenyl)acetyl-CoA isomerase
MAEAELLKEGAVATILLNRPERKNATTPELWRLLGEHLAELEYDSTIRAVILTGAGDAFCAGADVGVNFPKTPAETRERLGRAQTVIARLHSLPKPVIASVRGPAVGSGFSLALACDFVLASETARFSYAFTRLGLVADAGLLYLLSQRVGMVRSKELIYTGRFISGTEAEQLGICNHMVADTRLEEDAQKWASELAAGPTLAIAASKRLLHQAWTSLEDYLPQEQLAVPLMAEGIAAIREKRPPKFIGA